MFVNLESAPWGNASERLTVPAVVNGVANNVSAPAAAAFVAEGTGSQNLSGALGGLTAGYNWQSGNFVLGIEGDVDATSFSGKRVSPAISGFGIRVTDNVSANWFGTLRARAGFTAGQALFFVTGGAAFSNLAFTRFIDDTVDGCPAVGGGFGRCHSGSNTFNVGWTLGAGFEYAFNANWSAKVEYLYSDFGRASFRTLSATLVNQGLDNRASVTVNTVRVGLNYRFSAPAAAGVAAY